MKQQGVAVYIGEFVHQVTHNLIIALVHDIYIIMKLTDSMYPCLLGGNASV